MKTIEEFIKELDQYDPNMYVVIQPVNQYYEPTLHIPEPELVKETWDVNARRKPHTLECINMVVIYPGDKTHQRN